MRLWSDALTTNWNCPAAAAFTVQVIVLVWSPCVTCEEPLPVSVQREGTNWTAPADTRRPADLPSLRLRMLVPRPRP
jgi:hypothetical protein